MHRLDNKDKALLFRNFEVKTGSLYNSAQSFDWHSDRLTRTIIPYLTKRNHFGCSLKLI